MSHRLVFIPNWKANCENNLKYIPVEGRHVAIALENSPKGAQNMAKSSQIMLKFLKKVLEI